MFLTQVTGLLFAQDNDDEYFDQALETLAEKNDSESEDDDNIQRLHDYRGRPLDLNGPDAVIRSFPLLSTIEAAKILAYRKTFGHFVSKYELQAVPGISEDLVRKLLPFITIESMAEDLANLDKRWKSGKQSLLIRPSLIPEKQKGFIANDSTGKTFLGSRPRYFFRYRYQFKNLLEYGVTGDKDAGEPFRFNKQQKGFDFYSFHFFVRQLGLVKSLAIGDFTVNMGQGLIHWQSQAFTKSGPVINIKRESETLRPYRSAGEYNFLRGVGMTIGSEHWEVVTFASYKKISANFSSQDTLGSMISSVNNSGLYRTQSELDKKNNAALQNIGMSAKLVSGPALLSINFIASRYSLPILKKNELYNLYSIKGDKWWNASVDYAYSFNNSHLFGELAIDKHHHGAMLAGIMASLGATADFAVLYRSISKAYQSIFGNAFTENSLPTNESGLYLGFSFKPSHSWKIDIYADHFVFPWLRFRASAPGTGSELMTMIEWKPGRNTGVYSRLRYRKKPLDEASADLVSKVPTDHALLNWRIHFASQPLPGFFFRTRLELSRYNYPQKGFPDKGFLLYEDIRYKRMDKPYSVGARFEVFDCDSYDTRIYAYENDVLFASSTPALFNTGGRLYVNVGYSPQTFMLRQFNCDLGLKISFTQYKNQNTIGSGQDEISGSHKSEFKFQLYLSRK